MKKRNLLIFVLAATAIGATSCGSNENVDPKISISCVGNVTKLSLGETLQFTAKIEPETFDQKVEWSVVDITGDADISESGLLTPTKTGTIEVVAASYTDKTIKTSYPLKIEEAKVIAPTAISATLSEAEINVGKTANINFTVTPENASKEVTYKSLNEEVATVSKAGVVKGISVGEATIEVISTLNAEVKGTVSVKVNEEVIEETTDWSKVEVSTHAQYIDAKADTKIKVEGVCHSIFEPDANGNYDAYLLNGKGGFYLYGCSASLKLEVGKTYEICGDKTIYSNVHEIKNIERVTPIDKKIEFAKTEISDRDTKSIDNFKDVLGGYVNIDKATVDSTKTDKKGNITINVTYGENALPVYINKAWFNETDFAKLEETVNSLTIGYPVKFEGLMDSFAYGSYGKPQVKICSVDGLVALTVSDEDLLKYASESIRLENCIDEKESKIDLPTSAEGFEGVTITWSTDLEVVAQDGTITRPATTKDVSLNATFTKGDKKLEKTYTVTVIGNEKLTKVHTFDLDDALPAGQYGLSETKPSYNIEGANEVELGSPKATWDLKGAMIANDGKSDSVEGKFAMRAQYYKKGATEEDRRPRIELRTDFNFKVMDFCFAPYGTHTLDVELVPSYSLDGGKTWIEADKIYVPVSRNLEKIRFVIPEEPTDTTRIALTMKKGNTINIDSINLLK